MATDWPPCLWGSDKRIQYHSSSDRQRCRSLRAKAQPRDLLGRWVSHEHWASYQEYERETVALINYETRQQRSWWERNGTRRCTCRGPNEACSECGGRGRVPQLQRKMRRLQERIASLFEIPEPRINLIENNNFVRASHYHAIDDPGSVTLRAEWEFTNTANAIYTTNGTNDHLTPVPTDAELRSATDTCANFVEQPMSNYIMSTQINYQPITAAQITTNTITPVQWAHTYPVNSLTDIYPQEQTYRRMQAAWEPPPREPEPVIGINSVSTQMFQELGRERMVEECYRILQAQIENEWRERYGALPENPIWLTWVREHDSAVEVGFEMAHAEHQVTRTWERWVNQGVPSTVARGRPRVPTPEEVEAAARRQEEQERAAEERRRAAIELQRQREEEAKRAEDLLLSNLTPEQREQWTKEERFEVCGGRSHDRYQIARGRAGNVYLLDRRGNRHTSFCIHSHDDMPDADHCLSQKLLLESDEAEFLRLANASGVLR